MSKGGCDNCTECHASCEVRQVQRMIHVQKQYPAETQTWCVKTSL